MDAKRPKSGEPDARLCEVILDFVESAERGVHPDKATLLSRHPEFAAELQQFLDTWLSVERLTEPIRSVSQMLKESVTGSRPPAAAGEGQRDRVAADRGNDRPGTANGDRPGAERDDRGGWLGGWLRRHPPLSAEHYPFLNVPRPQGEIGRLGPYVLLEVVGSGGMGVVFRGEDVALRRPVAVKVLRAELAAEPAARERFLREARAAAALEHENVIAVYHVGEEASVSFIGMQWLRGMSLDELLRRAGRLEAPVVLRLGRQIALGLAAAHGRGLLHRDIKPANLWVESPDVDATSPVGAEVLATGRVKILDFGLALAAGEEDQLTRSGVTVGTPAYMSPEQATAGPVDARSDLFGLGVVLYRMCTGRLPFSGRRAATGSGEKAPPVSELNPAMPARLSDLVGELLATDPADRPASAAEVVARLQALEVAGARTAGPGQTVAAPPAPAAPRPAGGRWRRWLTAIVVALVLLLPLAYLLGGTVVRFATNRGEVVIVVDDPTTEVTVKEGGAVIEDPKGNRRITLTAGGHELEVSVRDPGGETRFFTKSFVLSRGGKKVVTVREELARAAEDAGRVPGGKPKELAPGARERQTAEWLLSIGGKLKVASASGQKLVQAARDLPAEEFQIVQVYLDNERADDAGLARLAGLQSLETLSLANTPVTDAGLKRLTGLDNLQNLILFGTKVTDAGAGALTRFPSLTSVDVGKTQVGDAGLAALAAMKSLKTLYLARTRVTDAGLAHLAGRKDFVKLDLSDTTVTYAGLAHLALLTGLQSLTLSGTRVTDAGLAHLAGLQRLDLLSLMSTKISDQGLGHLQALTSLRRLHLSGTKVTDAGMPRIASMKSLYSLDLTETQVGDAGLAILAQMGNLKGFMVGRTRVTDAGLVHLKGRADILSLDLGGTKVTDAGMAHLSGLKSLQHLCLNGTKVTEAGLAHLAALKQLRKLLLARTKTTDAGLSRLLSPPLPKLFADLDLSDTRVSAAGAAAVTSLFPDLQLQWWEPNRRAAEAVLAAGGSVRVHATGQTADAVVKTVAGLPNDYFRLTGATLSTGRKPPPAVLQALATLTDPEFDDFKELDLSGDALTDADLQPLAAMSCRRLVLNRNPLTGPGLAQLNDMPRLTDLDLECPSLSFLGVRYVGELKRLERLSLAGTGATDASLSALHGLVHLRELDLTGTKVTADGIAALKAAVPACVVKQGTTERH
jgi:Leucine-rich repeat (LRR) protein/tRNA A-37 threonylcarbamoyl transferase component Bud32